MVRYLKNVRSKKVISSINKILFNIDSKYINCDYVLTGKIIAMNLKIKCGGENSVDLLVMRTDDYILLSD